MLTEDQFPIPEGVQIYEADRVRTPKLKIEQITPNTTLADLSQDYALFNHTILFKYGAFTTDPVREYYVKNNIKGQPIMLLTPKPILSGLAVNNDATFNHTVLAVPLEIWTDLLLQLGTIGIYNRDSHIYGETVPQVVSVVDYSALSKATVVTKLPMVDITLLALETNKATLHFVPAIIPGDPVQLCRAEPSQHIIDKANEYFPKLGA